MKETIDMLIKHGIVITVNENNHIFNDGAVAISGNRIVDVGKTDQVLNKYRSDTVIDAKGMAVLPGLVNSHMHETLIRGFWDIYAGRSLYEEILLAYFMELCVKEKHALAAAQLNQLEMIKNGTTCFIDIWRHPHKAAETLMISGLRGVLAPQIADTTPWPPVHEGQYWMESVQYNELLFREWNNKAEERIKVWFGPHAPYSCTEDTLLKVRDLASKYKTGIHIHVSEGLSEVEDIKNRTGLRPVAWLNKIGFLGHDVHAAHCVWLDKEEIYLLKQNDVSVAHVAKGNMKSGMGVAPIPELLQAGVTVGLGTDSNMGPNNLDMIEEMRIACFLHRVHSLNIDVMSAYKVLEMATLGGARCLKMENEIGSLERGKKADVILLDLRKPHLTPLITGKRTNIVELIVYSAWGQDVNTVIVDGKILMENRKVLTMDENRILIEANDAASDLIQETEFRFQRDRKKVGL